MSIIDFIPYGKENAVKRDYLCSLLGLRDRKMRQLIQREKELGAIIINDQNGDGYYRSDDDCDLIRQMSQNQSRINSMSKQNKYLRKKLKDRGYRFDKYGRITVSAKKD